MSKTKTLTLVLLAATVVAQAEAAEPYVRCSTQEQDDEKNLARVEMCSTMINCGTWNPLVRNKNNYCTNDRDEQESCSKFVPNGGKQVE